MAKIDPELRELAERLVALLGVTMTVIYKFTARPECFVPRCTKPIAVRMQDGRLMVWAEVNQNMKYDATLRVQTVATGGTVPAGYTYVDTEMEGPFVWHHYVKVDPH